MRVFYIFFATLLLNSCGQEKHAPGYYIESKTFSGQEIPWINASVANESDSRLGRNLEELMSQETTKAYGGASQENIYTVREAMVQMVASMPFAMPFYCNPACYETSIILGLQDCQPYRFAIWYYYLYPPDDAGPRGRRHSGYCRGR
jgi:hypothetical protein